MRTRKLKSFVTGLLVYAMLITLVACSSNKANSTSGNSGNATSSAPAVASSESTADAAAEASRLAAEQAAREEEERKAAEEEAARQAAEEEARRQAEEEERQRQEEARRAEEERLAQEEAEHFFDHEWMLGRVEQISKDLGLPVVYGQDPSGSDQAEYYIFVEAEHNGQELYGFIISLYTGDDYWYAQAYFGSDADSAEAVGSVNAESVQQLSDFMAQYTDK